MNNTEDNIKRCEKLTEPQNANWIGISNQMAIAGVLARIKELEDDLYIADYTVENSIPIKKINDQIEKYKHMLALTTHGEIQKYTPGEIILKINTLEELLEEK